MERRPLGGMGERGVFSIFLLRPSNLPLIHAAQEWID